MNKFKQSSQIKILFRLSLNIYKSAPKLNLNFEFIVKMGYVYLNFRAFLVLVVNVAYMDNAPDQSPGRCERRTT